MFSNSNRKQKGTEPVSPNRPQRYYRFSLLFGLLLTLNFLDVSLVPSRGRLYSTEPIPGSQAYLVQQARTEAMWREHHVGAIERGHY